MSSELSEQAVCDLIREKSLLTSKGYGLILNGDCASLNITAITAIVNAALTTPVATAAPSGELPPLPEPDTHCFDEDEKRDVWSYSAELVQAYARAVLASLPLEQTK